MRVAMLFPGYGSQYVGMGKELYDEQRIVQEMFEEASNCLNINFVKLIFASSESELSKTVHAYPAIFLVSSAIGILLKQRGINPCMVAGLGIGEYSALTTVSGLSLPDGLYLLNKYSQLYQDFLTQHSFFFLQINNTTFKEIDDLIVYHRIYSNVLVSISTPNRVLVACRTSFITEFKDLLKKNNYMFSEASSSHGIHSDFSDKLLKDVYDYVPKIDFNDIEIPMIANRDGQFKKQGNEIKDAVLHTINNPIRWDLVCKNLKDSDMIIQVGPSNELLGDLQIMYPNKKFLSVNKLNDIYKLESIL